MQACTIGALMACGILLLFVSLGIQAIQESYTQQTPAQLTDDEIAKDLECLFLGSLEGANNVSMAYPYALMATHLKSGDDATKAKVREIISMKSTLSAEDHKQEIMNHFNNTTDNPLKPDMDKYVEFAETLKSRKQLASCA